MGCVRLAGSVLSAVLVVITWTAKGEPPPIDVYAALPFAVNPQLSPDGDEMAMISAVRGRPTLMVRQIDGPKSTAIGTGETLPDWFEWKTAKLLLASVRFTSYGSLGDPVVETRLFFLGADGKVAAQPRVSRESPYGTIIIGNPGNRVPQIQDNVVAMLPDDPAHLLMAVTPQEDYIHPDVVRIDVNTGRASVVQRHISDVVEWLADPKGQLRGAVKIGSEHFAAKQIHKTILVRPSEDAEWRVAIEGDIDKGRRFAAAGIAGTGAGMLYVLTDGDNGRLVARIYDIATGQWGAVVASDADCDVEAVSHEHRLIGFSIPCRNNAMQYLDPAWQTDYIALSKALKTDFVQIDGRSADGKRSLATVRLTPSAPQSFWLLDRRGSTTQARLIGSSYPKLGADQIAESRWTEYSARDGTHIPALLTLPLGDRRGAIPFVLLPHGGPTAHDKQGFDWMVQFLASRGYGVLQPQFRGSSGYGLAFEEAGYQQWGGVMQDDLTDGTRWLIGSGLADPTRIAIVGASYGGYAALMGVIKEPKLYACAAAFAPVTDLSALVGRLRHFAFKDLNIPRLKGEGQSLDAVSPVENVDKIQVPVLLMHGTKDFTVAVDQSEEMERALKRGGKEVEAIYLPDADHYFARSSERLAWLTALDKLLAANLGRLAIQ